MLICIPSSLFGQTTLRFSAVENTIPLKMVSEVLTQAYQRLGREIEVQKMPGKRALMSSNNGQTDGEAFRVAEIEKDNPNLVRVDVVIRVDDMHLFVKRGKEFVVDGWQSIPQEYLLGYQRGIKFIEKAVIKYGLLSGGAANNPEQLFLQLQRGRIDVAIHGGGGGVQLIQKLEIEDIVRLDPKIHSSYLYHYLHKKHAQLVPKITAALKEMKARGEFLKIRNKLETNQ